MALKQTIIYAKDFPNRSELENYLKTIIDSTSRTIDFKISGTGDELKNLHLSEDDTVWGITVIQTDAKKKEGPPPIPDRGPKFDSGLNKN